MMNQINIFFIILFVIVIFFLINKYLTNDESPPFPIDVVYTWKGEEVTNNIRTSYNHELQYSLRSIDLYAPWVNKIYILTDYPKNYPSWIKSDTNKIIMIDTTETFPHPSYLPNSNSNAIESTIVNINNLSEHYIYFCDDIFLGKKTKYTDFFTYDGKAIVDKYVLETTPILIDENNNINNIKYPPSTGRMYKHIPIPQIKSSIREFYEEYSDYIHWVRMTKNRNNKGFDVCKSNGLNTPCQQIHYPICKYMYAKNKAITTDNDYSKKAIFVKNKYENLIYALNRIVVIKPMFFCINDDQTDVSKREEARNTVLKFFELYFPNKPSFEK
jgi:hypothetical protein